MNGPTLEYARMPSRLETWGRRLLAAGIVVVSNVVAAASTVIILLAGAIVTGIVYAILTVFTNTDANGFHETTFGTVLLGIFFVIFWMIVAALIAPCVILTGITADAVRRALRWPWWTGFPAAAILALIGNFLFQLYDGPPMLWLALNTFIGAAILTALFCTYWIPLGCAESILRLVKWAASRFFEWRHRRKLERLDKLQADQSVPPPALPEASISPPADATPIEAPLPRST